MAKNQPARRNGIRYLVGSSLNDEEATKPAQEPPIPLHQLQPSHAEIVRAEDALKPRVVIRDGKKKPAPKKPPKHFTTRQRYSLTRLDVRDLLDKPGVAEALPINQEYRALADRNISIEDLAEKHHVSLIAMEAIIEGWESDIITKVCELYPRFTPHGQGAEPETDRQGEKSENESETAQDVDIIKTKGAAIGGRIISGGKTSSGRPRKLSDFERSGRIIETGCDPGKDRSGSQVSEQDDYGEESGA